jgi:hypothetical protein
VVRVSEYSEYGWRKAGYTVVSHIGNYFLAIVPAKTWSIRGMKASVDYEE